jgi:hypothetical protein
MTADNSHDGSYTVQPDSLAASASQCEFRMRAKKPGTCVPGCSYLQRRDRRPASTSTRVTSGR